MILLKTPNSIIIRNRIYTLSSVRDTITCSSCSLSIICDFKYIYKIGTTICHKFRITGNKVFMYDISKNSK